MCDVCADFHDLLHSYDERISQDDEVANLCIIDVDTILNYVNQWVQRQCMCCYRESKNCHRFIRLIHNVVLCTLQQLQEIQQEQQDAQKKKEETGSGSSCSDSAKKDKETSEDEKSQNAEASRSKLHWTHQDREKLFHLLSKIFLLNFPLYIAIKHGALSSPLAPVKDEGGYCEPHDPEVPAPLIHAVSMFCHHGGFNLMSACFDMESTLPVGLAHSMVAVICNLKLWLNYGSVIQLFIPLRSRVMKYMCRLSDKELRTQAVRTMADFMWSAVKDPIDAVLPSFDRDGLDLAFKYFSSTTLTMRLAGIAQINSHITAFNELCNSETVAEIEQVGHALANWLTDSNIIAHIFGPNLHVEVIKQSHIILSFLAMEGRISSLDMDVMWQAAQLKHCARPVYDLLAPLVKHLAPGPVLHLYSLLGKLEPKEHTEQSLFLVSALIKFIWTSSSTGSYHLASLVQGSTTTHASRDSLQRQQQQQQQQQLAMDEASTSSGDGPSGMEPSSPSEVEDEGSQPASEGPSPRKQARPDDDDDEDDADGDEDEPDDPDNPEFRTRLDKLKEALQRKGKNCSDVDHTSDGQDTDEGKTGERPASQGKKRKVLRKRKRPRKRKPSDGSIKPSDEKSPLEDTTNPQQSIDTANGSKVLVVDALDRVKQEAIAMSQSPVGLAGEQQLPRNRLLAQKAASQKLSAANAKYMPVLVAHDMGLNSADSSHDEDDSDIVAVVGAGEACLEHESGGSRFLPSCMDEMLSDEEGSYSSRISNKSEKNMADFEGEESGCEEELAQLAAQHLSAIHMQAYHSHHAAAAVAAAAHAHAHVHGHVHAHGHTTTSALNHPSRHRSQAAACRAQARGLGQFNLDTVCAPGQTLLWDLLQDDKIGQLGEGLALEAEKALCNLLCYNVERSIPMKFIEGCLDNLAANRSVVVSLRILPKLLASFQQFGTMDAHTITTWADRERGMMRHFFNNLRHYASTGPRGLHSHQVEVQVRLQFLSSIFSPLGSPECFRLSLEQVDTLWSCLADESSGSADELFSWLLSQAKSTEQHALGMDSLKHLCMRKLPSLPPESISMTGLSLFQQLCQLARLAAVHLERPLRELDSIGMDFLWKIALRAKSTEVSMAAIQYLNSYYMSRQLSQEMEFVSQCMTHLAAASRSLDAEDEEREASLRCIQRALLLLRTHLEAFKKRYAYHLRRWALEGRAAGIGHIGSGSGQSGERSQQIRVFVQPAGISDKTTFSLLSTDYVADLRAEVSKWWDDTHASQRRRAAGGDADSASPTSVQTTGQTKPGSVLGSLLTDGPIRMITQGQELTIDFDEKTLQELGFKDGQLVFISLGAGRCSAVAAASAAARVAAASGKRDLESPSLLPPPPRDSLPTLLLLRPQYFEQLFTLMRTLAAIKTRTESGLTVPHPKAQVLSRRVWDTLTLLPTSPTLLQGFQNVDEACLPELLDPSNPHKLMYSLYIVESLSKRSSRSRSSSETSNTISGATLTEASDSTTTPDESTIDWSSTFVRQGGLRHLFSIFMSGCLENSDGSEWQQDCLASLLKQICQLGVAGGRQATRRNKADKLAIPRLSEQLLALMKPEEVLPRIAGILEAASQPRDPNHYKTGLFGRSQLIHYALGLLVCWLHSEPSISSALFPTDCRFGRGWLRRLVLEDPEPAVRREVCTALYKLCLGSPEPRDNEPVTDASDCASACSSANLIVPLLSELLEYLPIAEAMHPQPKMRNKLEQQHQQLHPQHQQSQLTIAAMGPAGVSIETESKETYGPACRDYFWLVCRLVDSLPEDAISESTSDKSGAGTIDLQALAERAVTTCLERDYLETRHNTLEDDGLVGLLNLCCNIMAHNPPCKQAELGRGLLERAFDFLFALPTPRAKHVPKCKSQASRSAAFDLLVELTKGSPCNYHALHERLLEQHRPRLGSQPYSWDYWPHEDGRSDCGYVGLTNLGATCYMASCMQHLYMMPQARRAILQADCQTASKHQLTLRELQRMFAYLLESERKAYNPRQFCRVYTMNHEPLNTGEQKDMAEFFIDLVSKLEEMTPDLKILVKQLFCGIISNNVVSLDCEHVSRTLEEFYTVRCQVADMRNLYESLDEVTVKDTLEGDNMYTCSHCGKKVRAEKRACFKRLPRILCFNTMRYTFNMGTMLKEKVNTHFSFPLRLDMSGYMEEKLVPPRYTSSEDEKTNADDEKREKVEEKSTSAPSTQESRDTETENCQYELIGVTVHTGTADGGHYYSFIRERSNEDEHHHEQDRWFLFNDAEVKPFDPNQIAAECFGGEMTSKTYDSVTDKFMDFSFEKSNSAYMLFYERCRKNEQQEDEQKEEPSSSSTAVAKIGEISTPNTELQLSKELEEWIWQDNMHFLQDKNIFEHTYFSFMWQICGYVPQSLISSQPEISELAAELSASFFLETFIHAKEKPTMVQWVELLTKQFNSSLSACAKFLERMAQDSWWPVQILVKCPNQMVRQMFQRLCIHVIQRLRASQAPLYLATDDDDESSLNVGSRSCVTRFVRSLLSLMEHAKQHLKHLTEYFGLLYEFSKMGEEEAAFLIKTQAISSMVNFYLGHRSHEFVDSISEEEEEEEVVAISGGGGGGGGPEKLRPASLDKMITLIASLVERSRLPDHRLNLSASDFNAVAGGKGFPFLYQQIRDMINLQQTRNLIQSLCRWNDRLAIHVVSMIFQAISKHTDLCQPFFKVLTLLSEGSSPAGLPCMTQLILSRIWEVARIAPHGALEWLALAVTRSKLAHAWVLQGLDTWLQHFLLEHTNHRVRSAAAFLLVSLVPSAHFRQGYRSAHRLGLGCQAATARELQLSPDATLVLHQIYTALLRLLQSARHYTEINTHGTMSLTAYFALMTYCIVSKTEKLMFGPYLNDLWTLFHPKLSEPSIPVHHNKQALLLFWYHVSNDCPENVSLILHNPHITKNIAFNYILADHEDQDVVLFNRVMLPAYYGLLRLCCQQSRAFTRQLAAHQNIQWAFKNITPHPTQYSTAVDELFKLMQLLVARHPDQSEQEEAEIASFRRGTLSSYLQGLDGRSCWATLISAFRILIESDEDRLYVVYNGGLSMALEAFHMLHIMYHEATACHVAGDLAELIAIIVELVRCVRTARGVGNPAGETGGPEARSLLVNCKEWPDVLRKLATLLNTYNPADMRNLAIDLLKELVMLVPNEAILILAPLLSHCHAALQESHASVPPGPFLPRRSTPPSKMPSRPARPMVQMAVPHSQLEAAKGQDPNYDSALLEFFLPYHELIDVMCRLAINNDCMTEILVNLSAMLGFEGVPLHLALFPRLWLDVHAASHIDRKHITALLRCSYTIDYVDAVLLDERSSLAVPAIHAFLKTFFPKLASHVLTEQTCSIIDNLVGTLTSMVDVVDVQTSAHKLIGDLRALALVYSCGADLKAPPTLHAALETLLTRTRTARARIKESKQQNLEAPAKKRKFDTQPHVEMEDEDNDNHGAEDREDNDEDDNDDDDDDDEDEDDDDDEDEEEEEGSPSSLGAEEAKAADRLPLETSSAATKASTTTTTTTTASATTTTPSTSTDSPAPTTTTTTTTTAAVSPAKTLSDATSSAPEPATENVQEAIKPDAEEEEEVEKPLKSTDPDKTDQADSKSSSSLISASSTTSTWNSHFCRSMNNVSWLEMLEKTITNLQIIVQFQSKN